MLRSTEAQPLFFDLAEGGYVVGVAGGVSVLSHIASGELMARHEPTRRMDWGRFDWCGLTNVPLSVHGLGESPTAMCFERP